MLSFDDLGPKSSATPVILLHGFPLSRAVWADAAASLGKHRRALTVDLIGFGQSAGRDAWTLDDQARAVREVALQAGITRFVLGGLSMGGYVSLAYHRLFPQDLAGLLLVDTKSVADTEEGKEGRNRMADVARREGSATIAKLMFPKMLAPTAPQRVQDQLMSIMNACPAPTVATACIAMRDRPDFTPDLAATKVPVHVVTGRHDAITPPEIGKQLAQAAKGGYTEIADAGHMAPLERPDAVAAAINAFASKLD